jgi:RNA polymerase sigma-70 factor (ECF subfamily)
MSTDRDTSFEESLAAARSGDEAAFAMLWRRWQPPLLRYLRVLAPPVADDLASECWLQVVRGLPRFKGDETGFASWLFTIARNKVTDWRRQQRRRPTVSLVEEDAEASPAAAMPDAESAALQRLDTDAALRLIAALPPDQAEIVLLRVVAGLDVADVARIVRRSPGAVRVASHRALRRLRDMLGRSGEVEQHMRTGVTG